MPAMSLVPVARGPIIIADEMCGKAGLAILPNATFQRLWLDHKKLTCRFGGRDASLTDVHGSVVQDVLV